MTSIDPNNEFVRSVSLEAQQQASQPQDELGKDAFLELMIAQLRNQDPLNPAKNEDFIAQLAQFSSLEGIQNIDDSISGLAEQFGASQDLESSTLDSIRNIDQSIGDLSTNFRSSQALEASSMVGRSVRLDSDRALLHEGGEVPGAVRLDADAQQVTLRVETLAGEDVQTINLGDLGEGEYTFAWDGRNSSGEPMPAGEYRIRANGLIDGQGQDLPVYVGANVNSVTIGQGDEMVLNVDGIGAVPLSRIQGFF